VTRTGGSTASESTRRRTNVTGMSWTEFAGSASPRPGAAVTAGAAEAGVAEAGQDDGDKAEAGKAAAADKPKPTRRRRQGGIAQQ
jgi:hypothetical protein